MRSFKKVAAVALSAVMTLAMGVSAFADQTITFHFQNSSNWNPCGAWIYQGIAFTTNVTLIDKSPVVTDEVLEDYLVSAHKQGANFHIQITPASKLRWTV